MTKEINMKVPQPPPFLRDDLIMYDLPRPDHLGQWIPLLLFTSFSSGNENKQYIKKLINSKILIR